MPPKPIPDKLPGTVIPQYVRCGKPNCRCARGDLHGPYWYRFWREDPYVLHKEYVREADLEQVRAACEAYARDVLEGQALVHTGKVLIKRLGDRERSTWEVVEDMFAALGLMQDFDDFFCAAKGKLKQRLDMFVMSDAVYRLARKR